MIGLRVEAAAAALLEEGAFAVVLAPGAAPALPPALLALEWRDGALLRPGAAPAGLVALPPGARLLALVAAEEDGAARIAPLLPPGLPALHGPDPLPALLGLLAEEARRARDAAEAAETARDAAQRLLGHRTPPLPAPLLEVPPLPGAPPAPPRIVQPLGRPAEGLCAVALHLAEAQAGDASLLRVRLVAEGRIHGAWVVPGAALAPGWITFDLPEPLRIGAAEATLEVAAEVAPGDRLALSAGSPLEDAAVALRAWTSAPGRHVMPRHCDWAALDAAPSAGLPMALPGLEEAAVEGAKAERIAVGEEPGRLLLEIAAGAEAGVALPAIPAGPAELLRLALACRTGRAARVQAALRLDGRAAAVDSGWRPMAEDGTLGISLPLPATPTAAALSIRNGGDLPAVVELSRVMLLAGLAGERRRVPPAEAGRLSAPASAASPASPVQAFSVAMPGTGFRVAPPHPKLAAASPGAEPQEAAPAPMAEPAPAAATAFQDLKLQQHLVNADGTYRHFDVLLMGLVAPAGLWRQVRTKLFDRRGTIGLEFREARGWPQMFDAWPGTGMDQFGPFWRLESDGTAGQLGLLATSHDRALVAALMEVLPVLAGRAAAAAGLEQGEAAAWADRARKLEAAVAAARGAGA
ncbi:DUF6212 domain-containing protein [Falsiroseomonas sp. CW058]|uniref:DUF6212 domain-containing protein n=1 Tax=Falsiroseomonas sp. CW058 TaxID=3388664 RepID=UPI003D31BCB7